MRSYRPIRIQLKKEAGELAKEETLVVEERIKELEKKGDKFGERKKRVSYL